MNFRYTSADDREGIEDLWDLCFPDDTLFRDYYLKNIYKPGSALVALEDGKIIGMTHILRMDLMYVSTRVPSAYIYAVGTHPDYRGRGIAGRMMEHTFRDLYESGCSLAFLIPQEPGLFNYYRRQGFTDVFKITDEKILRKNYPPVLDMGKLTLHTRCTPTDGETEEALRLYGKLMRFRNHAARTAEHIKNYADICRLFGGGMYIAKEGDTLSGYAFSEMVEGAARINELFAVDEPSYRALCAGVLDDMKVESATLFSPACQHKNRSFGMVRIVNAASMLEHAARYKGNMDCTIGVKDELAPWNSGKYIIDGEDVKKIGEEPDSVYLTQSQLTDVLFEPGALPYINLLFN